MLAMLKITTFIKRHRLKIILIALTIVGFLIRFIYQPEVPYGFHRDEAGIAYSAYSVLKTGKDEWGRFMPLHFKALGDYPPGIYNYLVVLSIPFFGLTEMAERIPAIIFGTGMIPLAYLFVKNFFKKENLALITAFFVTFSPWMVVQSRAGSEALVALVFSLIGFLIFEKWVRKKNLALLIGVFIFYFLAIYSYNATKLVLPLIHGLLIYFFWKKMTKKQQIHQIIFGLMIAMLSFGSVFISSGNRMSFEGTSLLTKSLSYEALQVIFNREGVSGLSIITTRIFTNKFTNFGLSFIRQYFEYFNFNFLFSDAGFHKRYLVPQIGQLLITVLPFIVIGFLKEKIDKKLKIFLILWILLAPLPGAITTTYIPNLKRAMYMFFPLLIFAAIGLEEVLGWLKSWRLKSIAITFMILIYAWNLGYFAKQYMVHAKYETTQHRSYGYKELFAYAQAHENEYQQIKVYENIDTPHTFYLFYSQYPPEKYQAIPAKEKRDLFTKDKPIVQIGKYQFNPGSCPDHLDIVSSSLYLTSSGCFNDKNLASKMNVLKIIKSPDEMPIFYISELKKTDVSPSNL